MHDHGCVTGRGLILLCAGELKRLAVEAGCPVIVTNHVVQQRSDLEGPQSEADRMPKAALGEVWKLAADVQLMIRQQRPPGTTAQDLIPVHEVAILRGAGAVRPPFRPQAVRT